MRYINPNREPIPVEINYSNIRDEHNRIINNPNLNARGEIYRGEVVVDGRLEKRVTEALKRKYNNKCGYCESWEFNPTVEHHRPIGFVTGGAVHNNGYYWLAYEWTNMVASCSRCNERPYKGTKFPILNARTTVHPLLDNGNINYDELRYINTLQNEGPLLLHPEYCNQPEIHFTFNNEGEIAGVTPQGRVSRETYGLNDDTLCVLRRTEYKHYISQIERLIWKRLRAQRPISEEMFVESIGEVLEELLQRHQDPDNHPYTLFIAKMIRDFEHFFLQPFDPVVHPELRRAYENIFEQILDI